VEKRAARLGGLSPSGISSKVKDFCASFSRADPRRLDCRSAGRRQRGKTMLWKLDLLWLIMAVGTVGGVSYMLALMMESSIGNEGYGPIMNSVIITGGFFLTILGANYQGINLSQLKWALIYGGAGAFGLMLIMLLLRAVMNRIMR
jgi:hypothetical protein